MKLPLLCMLIMGCSTIGLAQEYQNPSLAGDQFSLEGALAVFKNAHSLENFETLINDQQQGINNLDLNQDGQIDYIQVDEMIDNNAHVVVLSTYLSNTTKQDIATIGIERTGNQEAILQIMGDDQLYTPNTIIEPIAINESYNPIGKGPNGFDIQTTTFGINVWFWPCVQIMFAPRYVPWTSPHYYGYYPRWWKPWRPFGYTIFYNRCAPHRYYYQPCHTLRVPYSRNLYLPNRHQTNVYYKPHPNNGYNHRDNRQKQENTYHYSNQNRGNNRPFSTGNYGGGQRRQKGQREQGGSLGHGRRR